MVLRAQELRQHYLDHGEIEAAEIMDATIERFIAIGLKDVLETDDGFGSIRALRTGAYLKSEKIVPIIDKLHRDDAKTIRRFLQWAVKNIQVYEDDSLAHLCMPDQIGHTFNMRGINTIPQLRHHLEIYDPEKNKPKLSGIGSVKIAIARKALTEFDELLAVSKAK